MNEKPFVCDVQGCGKAFARAHDLKRHSDLHNANPKFRCEFCHRGFRRLDALARHQKLENEQACTTGPNDANARCLAHSEGHCEHARGYQGQPRSDDTVYEPYKVSQPSEGLELPALDETPFA